jgi:hypothetical protein
VSRVSIELSTVLADNGKRVSRVWVVYPHFRWGDAQS